MDRRAFLKRTSFRIAAAATAGSPPGFSETPSLEQFSGPWDRAAIAHLLRRATIAPTVAEIRLAESKTMSELVDLLLAPPPHAPPSFPLCR